MTVEEAVTAFAGCMVLLSLALWWRVHAEAVRPMPGDGGLGATA